MPAKRGLFCARMGRDKIIKTPAEAQRRVNAWLKKCEETGEHLSITGLALALGFSCRDTLYDYEKDPAFSDTVKKARLHVEQAYERSLINGNNAAGPIFALKNMGWKDKQEREHTGPDGGPIEITKTVVNAG